MIQAINANMNKGCEGDFAICIAAKLQNTTYTIMIRVFSPHFDCLIRIPLASYSCFVSVPCALCSIVPPVFCSREWKTRLYIPMKALSIYTLKKRTYSSGWCGFTHRKPRWFYLHPVWDHSCWPARWGQHIMLWIKQLLVQKALYNLVFLGLKCRRGLRSAHFVRPLFTTHSTQIKASKQRN